MKKYWAGRQTEKRPPSPSRRKVPQHQPRFSPAARAPTRARAPSPSSGLPGASLKGQRPSSAAGTSRPSGPNKDEIKTNKDKLRRARSRLYQRRSLRPNTFFSAFSRSTRLSMWISDFANFLCLCTVCLFQRFHFILF